MSQLVHIVGIDPASKQHPDDPLVWVTPDGRVYKRVNQNHPERRQWLEYVQETDKDGYKSIRIKRKKWLIHRLVYLLFVGELLPELVICHLDGNVQSNHYSNLEQTTQQVNISHKKLHGTHQAGEQHPRSIHTHDQIQTARWLLLVAKQSPTGRLARGEALRISQETGVSLNTVRDLSSKGDRTWV